MLFHSWHSVLSVALRTGIAYLVVVAALRLVGEQALAKMSAYDLVVTIALGSAVAEIPFVTDLSVVDGLAVVFVMLLLQEAIRWAQARSKTMRKLIREQPCLVVWDGAYLEDRLAGFNITREEVRAAIRRAGHLSVTTVQAVVLENDGDWSVMARDPSIRVMDALRGLDCPAPPEVTDDDHAGRLATTS